MFPQHTFLIGTARHCLPRLGIAVLLESLLQDQLFLVEIRLEVLVVGLVEVGKWVCMFQVRILGGVLGEALVEDDNGL